MLCGQRAFHGDSAIEVMNAILKEEPAEFSETNMKINPAAGKDRAALSGEEAGAQISDGAAIWVSPSKPYPRLQTRGWNLALPALEPRNTDSRLWHRERWLIAAAIACCSDWSPRSLLLFRISEQLPPARAPSNFRCRCLRRPLLEATQYRWPFHLTANAWLSSRLMKATKQSGFAPSIRSPRNPSLELREPLALFSGRRTVVSLRSSRTAS